MLQQKSKEKEILEKKRALELEMNSRGNTNFIQTVKTACFVKDISAIPSNRGKEAINSACFVG